MFGWFRDKRRETLVARVYGELVAQARDAHFYRELGVPDIVEGRFDLLVLHLVLLMRRASSEDATAREAAQAVCDHFFTETDRALREMGVGDLSVPKKIKGLAGAYAGRSEAYARAFESADEGALAATLSRNVYAMVEGDAPAAAALARYVRAAAALLASRPALDLIENGLVFPPAKEFWP
jgi:cytochrome b pre-mRNA-processing protein 3